MDRLLVQYPRPLLNATVTECIEVIANIPKLNMSCCIMLLFVILETGVIMYICNYRALL